MYREKVASLAHYSAIVKQVRQAHPILAQNSYLMPSQIQRLTQQGGLLYEIGAQGALFFQDEGAYVKLSYLLDPTQPFRFRLDGGEKPLILEFLQTERRQSPHQALMIQRFQAVGFQRQATTLRMQAHIDQLPPSSRAVVPVQPAPAAAQPAIERLWQISFDPLIHQLPTSQHLRAAISEGRVLAAMDGDGNLTGVLMAEFGKRYGWIWHEAVLPSCQGQGIGRALTLAYLRTARSLGITDHRLWVVAGQDAAQAFHRKFGFAPDGTTCEQYKR